MVIALVFIAIGIVLYLKQPAQMPKEQKKEEKIEATNLQWTPQGNPLLDSLIREINGHMLVQNCNEAVPLLKQALQIKSDPQGHFILGQCILETDPAQALLHFEKSSLEHASLAQFKEKAQRLLREKNEMGELLSSHFSLQIEAQGKTWNAGPQLLQELEFLYDQFAMRFQYQPTRRLPAVLFADTTFQIPGVPDWTGALFDGKIRIPFNVLQDWPKHKSTLAHELAHAFVHEISQQSRLQVPIWFDEGIAQIAENTPWNEGAWQALGRANSQGLWSSFMVANAEDARRLYWTSWAMCRVLLGAQAEPGQSLQQVTSWLQDPQTDFKELFERAEKAMLTRQ